ncbi:MAG: hypothetical protein DRP63_05965 [Planctomycetota bacterium]|nr:MAG: hypothetical protein DRP63_05965 [Planctomycetota bacterium]
MDTPAADKVRFVCSGCEPYAPVDERQIEVGAIVKAIFRTGREDVAAERMWLEVKDVDRSRKEVIGVLLNSPLFVAGLRYGSTVRVPLSSIIEVSRNG